MPVPKGSPIDPAATRGRLLDAAIDLFAARGINAVGVAEVAAAAGASKLSLYRHFRSKDDLVAAVVAERSQRVQRWLRQPSAAPPGEEGVLAVFDLLGTWIRGPGFVGCAIVNAVADTRDTSDAAVLTTARAHLDGYRGLLIDRLQNLTPPPVDAEQLSRQLLLLIEGAITVARIDSADAIQDARAAAGSLIASAPRARPSRRRRAS